MKDKHQAKYLSKDETSKAKSKKPSAVPVVLVCVLVAALIGGLWYLWKNRDTVPVENAPGATDAAQADPEQTEAAANSPIHYSTIKTVYGALQFDEDYMDQVRHQEVIDGEMVMEVFYMPLGNSELELFRLCFGEGTIGDSIGKLHADGQDISVRIAVSEYAVEDFPDEETLHHYYALMEQMNVVVASIREADNFVEDDALTGTGTATQQVELTYWTVELPESIFWEEHIDGGVYSVDFFGFVGGERIRLYTVCLGSEDLDGVLGMYEVDSGKEPVSVKTYKLESQIDWQKEEDSMAYAAMMETINDVIRAIMSDVKFSVDMP